MPNLLPNVDECKKIEIRTHSSLLKGQIFFFQLARFFLNKSTNMEEYYTVLPSISHKQLRMNRIE